jgi:hypothetical protein
MNIPDLKELVLRGLIQGTLAAAISYGINTWTAPSAKLEPVIQCPAAPKEIEPPLFRIVRSF